MAHPVEPVAGERIAKLLARAGVASRREVERMIGEGRVAVGGVAIDTPATVLGSLAGVTVDGNPVAAAEPARLFLYHKPPGLLVTERDPRGRPTIYDRLPADLPRLVPVGRLDLNTEGLLLLTTDGGLKRQLELPATGVERTYRARAYGPVSQAGLEALIEGVEIDGFRYGPIDANLERRTGANSWIELRLAEGKNREVRRVLEYLGLEVSRLIRTSYGPFVLGDLPPGAVGEVRERDLTAFRATLGKQGAKVADIAVAASPRRAAAGGTGGRVRRPTTEAFSPIDKGKGASPPGRFAAAPPPKSMVKPRQRPTVSSVKKAGHRPPTTTKASPVSPGLPRGVGGAKAPLPSSTKAAEAADTSTRPAKILRKAGWARPKPKAGPRSPKKR